MINKEKSKLMSSSDKAKFDSFYSKLRNRKKTGWAEYAPGSEDRIVNSLQTMGLTVYDFEIDVDDYDKFVDFCDEIDKMELREIRIQKE